MEHSKWGETGERQLKGPALQGRCGPLDVQSLNPSLDRWRRVAPDFVVMVELLCRFKTQGGSMHCKKIIYGKMTFSERIFIKAHSDFQNT